MDRKRHVSHDSSYIYFNYHPTRHYHIPGIALGKERLRITSSTKMFGRWIKLANRFIIVILARHGALQVGPPVPEPLFTNESKPRTKQEGLVLKHALEFLHADPLTRRHFIVIWIQCNSTGSILDAGKQDVINFMLAPWTGWAMRHGIGGPVMQSRQKVKVLHGESRRNAEFLGELANGRVLDTRDLATLDLIGCVDFTGRHAMQGMRATRIGPDTGKGDFVRGALLQQEFVCGLVKDKDGKGAVQNAMWLLRTKDV